ncbi:MAG: DUF3833 domain-containing protein [Gammaproteobacteria bacterium]|nr:DUF3833 domain-containing protein [Gammaproteobacteria bacterium]
MKYLAVGAAVILAGCGVASEHYVGEQPPLKLEEYLSGTLIAVGTVQDYRSAVTRRMCVELEGRWVDGVGTLDEQFYFDDGERQQRIWTLRPSLEGYVGTAADVKGEAAGVVGGFAMNWRYGMDIDVDGSSYAVTFDDWLYQLDERYLLNRADIRKFGVTVAEVTLMFDKGTSRCPESWHQRPVKSG